MAEAGRSVCGRPRPLTRNLRGEQDGAGFFYFFLRNALKSLDSEKFMKGNESNFAFISLLFLSLSSP
jgi:hypothetical protein